MTNPTHLIPTHQAKAFHAAMAERLGMTPEQLPEDFSVSTDGDGATVEWRGRAYLPEEEVREMFNAAGR